MGCPSDRWFFGSVFVFLVAVGMLAGGAVNMQLASDDPRTPRVKSYDGYVDAWQNTHFAEYNTKYTSVPATATLTRGAEPSLEPVAPARPLNASFKRGVARRAGARPAASEARRRRPASTASPSSWASLAAANGPSTT